MGAYKVEPAFHTLGRRPLSYFVVGVDGEKVALVRKMGIGWSLHAKGPMPKRFPSRMTPQGTRYKGFSTVASMREWVASPEAIIYLLP